MHIHFGRIHVGKAPRDVVAAARKRPVTHVVDFEFGAVRVYRRELEPKLRNFLLQEFDRGIRQHMGMDVDGSRHICSRAWLLWCRVFCAYLAGSCNTGARCCARWSFSARLSAVKNAPKSTVLAGNLMDATTGMPTNKSDAQHHPRVEDEALVRGLGRYIGDAPAPNQAFAYFVRSPHAFARIASIDTEAAKNTPGVIAVLTANDMDGVGNISDRKPGFCLFRAVAARLCPHRQHRHGSGQKYAGRDRGAHRQ